MYTKLYKYIQVIIIIIERTLETWMYQKDELPVPENQNHPNRRALKRAAGAHPASMPGQPVPASSPSQRSTGTRAATAPTQAPKAAGYATELETADG